LNDQIEKNEMGGHATCMEGEERCIEGLVGKPEKRDILEDLA
jgi:hypothetical protein